MIKNFTKANGLRWLISFVLSLMTITWANASHLRAGQITVVRSACNTRLVFITITVYTNTGSDVKFGEDGVLSFGDNTPSLVIEAIDSDPQPQLGPFIGIASKTVAHTYSGNGNYLISYVEPNRNGGVLNMFDSFNTTFYLETYFSLATGGCNNSPQLKIPPIDQACAGVAFFHNPGAYDINPQGPADSLSYELVVPYKDRGAPVDGYIRPENPRFSDHNESGGAPTFTINAVDGTLIWDTPDLPGEYNVAFHVNEWRKINGIWTKIGYVRRDMQIIVNGECENERPILIVPNDTCVVAESNIHKFIRGEDRDLPPDDIKIQAYSQIFEFSIANSRATRTPVLRDGDNIDFKPSPDSIEFNWNTICNHIKGQAYDVVFKVTDNPDKGPNLATFETWKITVAAPPPVLNPPNPPTAQRFVQLNWATYACSSIANDSSLMQIWQRVDSTIFTPTTCQTGMPRSLGYSLIATVPLASTSYIVTNNGAGLERGVKYCYRLVAVFKDRGAESPVSNEVCIDPIDIAAPLITKVTVDKTDLENGEITVSWIPPLNPDPAIDPDDYLYEVQRVDGAGFMKVSAKLSKDTRSFSDQGLNTFDRQYSYRVMLYEDGNVQPKDSSSVASSVWLNLTTANRVIDLDWRASVPWSNQIQGLVHDVYGKQVETATTLSELDFLTTVDVTVKGLQYTAESLDSTRVYCYAVVTRGSYGNDDPAIRDEEPLENVSQINCAKPTFNEPPCAPTIVAFGDPCENYFGSSEYSCVSTLFETTIRWSMPEDCNSSIKSYEVYQASTQDVAEDDYVLVATVTDTFVTLQKLPSLAYCYRIVAIDRSNSRSVYSARVCNENCPNYELPNVFTPNGDNCNDVFAAYGASLDVEGVKCSAPDDDDYERKCARFVSRVDIKIFNRWGKEIYTYVGQRGNENNIYINWDGRDKSGKELATGIYFYSADVTFDSTGPGGKTVKTIKGWVHLVR